MLRRKWIAIVLTLAVFVGAVIGATRIGTSLMPSMDSSQMSLTIEMPKGSGLSDTAAMSDTVMKKIREIPDVDGVGAMVSSHQAWEALRREARQIRIQPACISC